MTIEEQVSKGIMAAMKAKDTIRLEVLRNIKKVFIEAKSVAGAPEQIADSESVKIIQKLAKQGRESAEIYKNQGREDLYAHEMAQVEVLSEFLPKQLSEEELRAALKAIIEKVGATSAKEMGKVMGVASKELAGVADGQTIKLKGQGGPGVNGGPAGDLYITFVIAEDPVFKRLGNDLYVTAPLNLYSAVLGGEQVVDTMNGKVKLKVKPGTQNGAKVRLKGKGFPVYKEEGKFGDLIVTYSVEIPTNLTEKQKELFQELQKLS